MSTYSTTGLQDEILKRIKGKPYEQLTPQELQLIRRNPALAQGYQQGQVAPVSPGVVNPVVPVDVAAAQKTLALKRRVSETDDEFSRRLFDNQNINSFEMEEAQRQPFISGVGRMADSPNARQARLDERNAKKAAGQALRAQRAAAYQEQQKLNSIRRRRSLGLPIREQDLGLGPPQRGMVTEAGEQRATSLGQSFEELIRGDAVASGAGPGVYTTRDISGGVHNVEVDRSGTVVPVVFDDEVGRWEPRDRFLSRAADDDPAIAEQLRKFNSEQQRAESDPRFSAAERREIIGDIEMDKERLAQQARRSGAGARERTTIEDIDRITSLDPKTGVRLGIDENGKVYVAHDPNVSNVRAEAVAEKREDNKRQTRAQVVKMLYDAHKASEEARSFEEGYVPKPFTVDAEEVDRLTKLIEGGESEPVAQPPPATNDQPLTGVKVPNSTPQPELDAIAAEIVAANPGLSPGQYRDMVTAEATRRREAAYVP